MGSIEPYETANGRRYWVRYRRPDHRQGAKRGFRTKREAERYLISVESQMQTGDFINPRVRAWRWASSLPIGSM